MNTKLFMCCICNGVFTGEGNNPWPVDKRDNVVCCDRCNSVYVIPARIKSLFESKERKS